MGDAHALGELARLAVEATLGEEADRLVENRLLAVGAPHVAPARARACIVLIRRHWHLRCIPEIITHWSRRSNS
jgi:hypothetical protein